MNLMHNPDKKRSIAMSAAMAMRIMPHSYPFVLIDRVKACYAEEGVGQSIKNVTLTDPVLSGHFPGYPIYPGVMIIEAMVQNAGMVCYVRDLYKHLGSYEAIYAYFETHSGTFPEGVTKNYFLADSRVKNTAAVYPGDTMEMDAKLILDRDGFLVFKVSASVDGKEVAKGQVTMASALADAVPTLAG